LHEIVSVGRSAGRFSLRSHRFTCHRHVLHPQNYDCELTSVIFEPLFIIVAIHFTDPERMVAGVKLVCFRNWTSDLQYDTHEWTSAGVTRDMTNRSGQTVIKYIWSTVTLLVRQRRTAFGSWWHCQRGIRKKHFEMWIAVQHDRQWINFNKLETIKTMSRIC